MFGLMKQHAIPKPTTLLAHVLVLRIAAVVADDQYAYGGPWWTVEVSDIKIQLDRHVDYEGDETWKIKVIVRDEIVDFDEQESDLLIGEFRKLLGRSRAAYKLRRDAENQHRALDVLEAVITCRTGT